MSVLVCIGVLVLFSVLPGVQLQEKPPLRIGVASCERPTMGIFGSFDGGSTDGIVAAAYQINNFDSTEIRIVNVSIVCEASGETRDTISSISAIVQYVECSDNECGGMIITEHLRWDCLLKDGVASFSGVRSGDVRDYRTPPADEVIGNLSTPLMDQCGQCARPAVVLPSDPATYCLACEEECIGLGKCLGNDDGQCCNYYYEDNCVISCPDGLAPNSLFDCVFDCGMADLLVPEFGQLTVDSTLFGSVATYTCDSGYTLVGNAMRTCLLSGWSGTNPVCAIASDPLTMANSNIKNMILNDTMLRDIQKAEPLDAVDILQDVFDNGSVEAGVVVYLLGDILNNFNSTDIEDQEQLVEMILDLGDALTRIDLSMQEIDVAVVGSSLLNVLDRLAFEVLTGTTNYSTENIFLQTQLLAPANEGGSLITAISSEEFITDEVLPRMSIQISSELIEMFVDRDGNDSVIRAVSYLYYNVEGLFPSGFPGENSNESVLASGIVSTALQCETERCRTDDLVLNTPVLITIQHSEFIELRLKESDNSEVIVCVFWEFLQSSEDGILSIGQWSDRGCSRCESLSNTSVTVCECNHLTHFAILLSAAPLNLTDAVTLSLEIISYVGVSVSMIAMGLTVFTFILLKSLHNMRNFIHINLCISLAIAQLIFVIGIDLSGDDEIPLHCQAIAVLLHYFFLVSFMWMLMEGVVLYIILVEVFVSSTKSKIYVSAFTIASYGVPLLYLGITIPLGFALPTQPNYGYHTACFLNPETKFIWAFIAPVIVIILINGGFFIMAAVVIWRHNMKKGNSKTHKHVKSWLKVSASLVVVMGLTWILGVLIVEVKELVPLAYIYTIMVAFQGVWIFLIFVVFQEQVRNDYLKLWRTTIKTSDKHYSVTSTSKDKNPKKAEMMEMSRSGANRNMHSTISGTNDSTSGAIGRGETVVMIL